MGSIAQYIATQMLMLNGVTSAPHRYGGVEFHVKGREIGHLHGDRMADIPFPKKVRDLLIAEGKAQPHHLLKDTGWISYYLHGQADTEPVLELLRLNYRIITDRKAALSSLISTP